MANQLRTVYVIDDDESVRTALGRLLRSAKFVVETFSSADDFLSSPRQERDSCILLDLTMPGMHGFDFQKKLISSGVKIPVIVVSATDDELVREYGQHLGAMAFLHKPVDDEVLLDAVTRAIEGTSE